MLEGFERALQEYEWKMQNPYDEYDYIPEMDDEEDPEVDRRLEDRDE